MALLLAVAPLVLLATAGLGGPTITAGVPHPQRLVLDPAAAGLRYDGTGALSAGASSRLLRDYAPALRSEILDLLFKPKFGASLSICKVELPGDTQSSEGTEPSHMHTRDDLNCTRGYEFWLMAEAKKRNPRVLTYGLAWGAPGWINNQTGFYGPDLVVYQLNWLKCARDFHGIEVDYLGLWNEMPWGSVQYVKQLKKAISAAGLKTQLILGDGQKGQIPPVLRYRNDTEFMAAFSGVGLHYPCDARSEYGQGLALRESGKFVWSSEDLWSEANWSGAACWAKTLTQNFIRANITASIAWSTVWSVYPVVDILGGSHDAYSGDGYWGPGLMYAWQPWSGHYAVPPTIWATAHLTQFVEPGWRMLWSCSGDLSGGGSYLSMVSPDQKDFSTVFETGHAHCPVCSANNDPTVASNATQTVRIELLGSLAFGRTVHVWHTNNSSKTFVHRSVSVNASGVLTLLVEPESIYTVTSTTGQSYGAVSTPPPSTPFPLSWADDFDNSTVESLPKYWADQCGSFQVMPSGGNRSGNSIRQRVPMHPGKNKWHENLKNPLTVLGGIQSSSTKFSVDVRVPAAAFPQPPLPPPGPPPRWHPAPLPPPSGAWVGLCGRVSSVGHNQNMGGVYCGLCLQVNSTTATGGLSWRVEENGTDIIASGAVVVVHEASTASATVLTAWHTLELAFDRVGDFTASIDGAVLTHGKTNATAGMAALSSGWHVAEYDRFNTSV